MSTIERNGFENTTAMEERHEPTQIHIEQPGCLKNEQKICILALQKVGTGHVIQKQTIVGSHRSIVFISSIKSIND